MPQKGRLPNEQKIQIVEDYLAGKIGMRSTCRTLGIGLETMKVWIRLYKTRGQEGLIPVSNFRHYSPELKETVVKEYLKGGISQADLCSKYDITHSGIVRKWLKKYNCHKGFRKNTSKEVPMTKGRPTTFDERLEMVSECISAGKDYNKIAEKYGVSYQQIYGWVRRYEIEGPDGLNDRRGIRKEESNMTETEKLRAELRMTKAKLRYAEMENDLLKKLDEIERRGRWR